MITVTFKIENMKDLYRGIYNKDFISIMNPMVKSFGSRARISISETYHKKPIRAHKKAK